MRTSFNIPDEIVAEFDRVWQDEGRIPVALAGVGFLGAIGMYLVDYRRQLLYLVGIVYTAIQIAIWYVVKTSEYTTVGYVDKDV